LLLVPLATESYSKSVYARILLSPLSYYQLYALVFNRLELVPSPTPSTLPNFVDFPVLEDIEFNCQLLLPSLTKSLKIRLHKSYLRLFNEFDHWNQFFEVIGDVTTARFEALHVNDNGGSLVGFNPTCISKMSGVSLTTLTLVGPVFNSIRRQDIVAIVEAWPLLIELSLTPMMSCETPEVGFSSLIDIAVGLPRLKKLLFSIDSRDLPQDVNGVPLCSHGLEDLELTFCNSSTAVLDPDSDSDQVNVVQSVDRLFPSLKSWSISFDEDSDGSGRLDVQYIIRMLQKVRMDQVLRMNLGLGP